MNPLTTFLAVVGGAFLFSKGLYVLQNLMLRFVVPTTHPLKYGKWAVVTGATDGIGKAIAFELAKKGCSLLLISRTQSKLDKVKAEIKEINGAVDVETLSVDYSEFELGSEGFKQVKEKLVSYGKDLGLLVNNVGMSYPFPKYFEELTDEECSNLISLNIISTSLMTKIYLPLAKANKSGSIVNIGSFAGVFPSPLLTQYSAAKSYIEKFSAGLNSECEGSGVNVQCHVPLYIVSKMSKIRKSSMMVPSAEDYAGMVVSNLGKGVVISPHFIQSFLTEVLKLMPSATLLQRVKALHEGIRKKGMKKLERQRQKKE